MLYKDRRQAGQILATELLPFATAHPVVLAIPRGGVPAAYEVAKELEAPLEVIMVRKIGAPHNPEFGVGAISEHDTLVLDNRTLQRLGVSEQEVTETIQEERKEMKRRIVLYRKNQPLPALTGKTVILVDDGLATGMTAQAAVEAITKDNPQQIIFAAPVCSNESAASLRLYVDEVICDVRPYDFQSVGMYYEQFNPVSDQEVKVLLQKAHEIGGNRLHV